MRHRPRDPADGLANAVWLRLATPLGSYWADATLGSRLHELQRDQLIHLPRGMPHAVRALEESSAIVTIVLCDS